MKTKEMIKHFITTEIANSHNGNGIGDNESLIERGILDSLGIIKLLTFFEKKLSITIGNNDLVPHHFESINTIANLLENKLTR